jgi:hypothetical protein
VAKRTVDDLNLNAEKKRELTELRAEEASWAAQLSDTEKKIAETLKVQEVQRMKEYTLSYKNADLQRQALEVIQQSESIQRALTEEMAEQFGLKQKTLPYASEIASIEEKLKAIEQGRSGLAGDQLAAMRETYVENLNLLKLYQQEKVQLDKMKEVMGGMDEALGLASGTIESIGTKIVKFITNPWTIVTALLGMAVLKWKDMQEASENFRKGTGLTVEQMKDADTQIRNVSRNLRPLGVGFAEANKAAEALYDTFGNMALINEKNVGFVADMSARMGVSEEVGAKFVKSMSYAGADVEKMGKTLEKIAVENGVSAAAVMSDIAESTEGAYTFLAKNPQAFVRTAAEARKLGMTMQQISNISEGLLDIENSLGSEMEAQIISGKSLNLDAARYYALVGDQEGVLREITKNVGTIDEFNKMGVLQQQAIAKAFGMTVDDMAKMLQARKEEGKLSAEEKRARQERAKQDQTIQSTMTEIGNAWSTIISDLSSVFLPLVEDVAWVLGKIAKGVAWVHEGIAGWSPALRQATALVAGLGVAMAAVMAGKGIGKMLGGVGGMFGKIGTGIGKGISGTLSGVFTPLKDFMGNVKPTQMLAAGAAMVMMAGAVWIMADAMGKLANVKWGDILFGIGILGALVGAVLLLGTISTSAAPMLVIGGLAILAFAGAVWVVADAAEKLANASDGLNTLFGGLMGLDVAKLFGVGAGLTAVGYGLGAMAIGAAALGVVGAIFGGGAGATTTPTKDKTDIVIEKLDKLIEVLDKKNFSLEIDGKKLNKQLAVVGTYG